MGRPRLATLTIKQEAVATLLASGRELRSAALEIGVAERTVHTWKHRPEFKSRVAALRDEMLSQAVGKLSRAASAAVDALTDLLASKDESVKLRASQAILDGLLKAREFTELAARVAELEGLAPPPPNGRAA